MNQALKAMTLATLCGLAVSISATGVVAQTFQQLSAAEKQAYVKEKAHRIGAAITGHAADLSPVYLSLIAARVDAYAERIGNNVQDVRGQEDLRRVLARAARYAPAFAKTFQDHKLPPLIGIYLPLMESEYRNEATSEAGSAGMFQFMETTALRFGLTPEERTDQMKAADAAARYLSELQTRFAGDLWLSLLSYNQGENAVEKMLGIVPEARGAACSICLLIEKRSALGKNFQGEGASYTALLIAVAIIGEYPRDFGIEIGSLSTLK